MERKLFLDSCQRYAVFNDTTVMYNGSKYYPDGYQLRYDKHGNIIHTAILRDMNKNTLVYCNLADVK